MLRNEYHDDLERLLFFNPLQKKMLKGISHSIHEYGVPTIDAEGDKLRVRLRAFPEAQTLYALEDHGETPKLVGVMVYARTDVETLALLHIAVDQEYARLGARGRVQLVPRFITQLREIGRRIKGIRTIDLKYSPGLSLPVRSSKD